MTEGIKAITYLVNKLNGDLECHCDVFRFIDGMTPETARRRLSDYRYLYKICYIDEGYIAHRTAHRWTFTRPFVSFLKRQIKAAQKSKRKAA